MLSCCYAQRCSGCDWIDRPAEQQRNLKIEHLRQIGQGVLPPGLEIHFRSMGEGGLRDRVDLVLEQKDGTRSLGLFDRDKTGIVDLANCPQLSPALAAWLNDFRAIGLNLPVQRGSIRLRVAPSGERGVWLDFANVDVKNLLDEQHLLSQLMDHAVVEIGQRRKRLVKREGALKLADPVLLPWFETYLDEKPVPLHCAVGGFTQPGFHANRVLVAEVMGIVKKCAAVQAVEFGAGIGNFTLPLAQAIPQVDVCEMDELALRGLAHSAQQAGLTERIRIHKGNFQGRAVNEIDFSKIDLVLVDPPRSGLMSFLDPLLQQEQLPRHFIYVSCFPESLVRDLGRLVTKGYQVAAMTIIDQFPQTHHFEVVTHLTWNQSL